MEEVAIDYTVQISNSISSEVQYHCWDDELRNEIKILYFKQTVYIDLYVLPTNNKGLNHNSSYVWGFLDSIHMTPAFIQY